MINVTAVETNVLKALLLIAGKNDVRFYLNGVYFDTEHDALVATDGHKMLFVKHELPKMPKNVRPFIVPRIMIEQLLKFYKGKNSAVVVCIDAGTRTDRSINLIRHDGSRVGGPEESGTYPQWRRVVPKTFSAEAVQFDAEFTAPLQAAFVLIGGVKNKPSLYHNGHGAALAVGADPTAVGLVMPMRAQTDRAAFTSALKNFGF